MAKIFVLGSSNTDMVMTSDRLPKPGETILGGVFNVFQGGKGANQAVACARSGAETIFMAKVGDDSFGEEAIKAYKKDNINTDLILKSKEEATGTAVILLNNTNAENSIIVASGANAELTANDVENVEDIIASCDVLLTQLETPIETVQKALELAKKHKVKTILNPAPAKSLTDDLLSLVDYITPNESECEILTGIYPNNPDNLELASNELIKKIKEGCVITLGEQGSYYKTIYECASLIPTKKVDAIDTTAAGDTFNGYFAKHIADGKNIDEAALFANRAASKAVTILGAQNSIPYDE